MSRCKYNLGPPAVPFFLFFWGSGSFAKVDYRKKGPLILTSLLEDLVMICLTTMNELSPAQVSAPDADSYRHLAGQLLTRALGNTCVGPGV